MFDDGEWPSEVIERCGSRVDHGPHFLNVTYNKLKHRWETYGPAKRKCNGYTDYSPVPEVKFIPPSTDLVFIGEIIDAELVDDTGVEEPPPTTEFDWTPNVFPATSKSNKKFR